jgi:hypothetical protein
MRNTAAVNEGHFGRSSEGQGVEVRSEKIEVRRL